MMPRSSDQLLLPVNPWFMWTTLVGALLLNLIPLGRQPAMPDLMALALVFWNVHQPRRVGVGAAFLFGLFTEAIRVVGHLLVNLFFNLRLLFVGGACGGVQSPPRST